MGRCQSRRQLRELKDVLSDVREQLSAMNCSAAHVASWVVPRTDATTKLIARIDAALAQAATGAQEHDGRGALMTENGTDALRKQVDELNRTLSAAKKRMDRARKILTNNNPSPTNNWGMLDVKHLGKEGNMHVPSTEDEAALMALLGMEYLQRHAPHRLTAPQAQLAKLVEAVNTLYEGSYPINSSDYGVRLRDLDKVHEIAQAVPGVRSDMEARAVAVATGERIWTPSNDATGAQPKQEAGS